MRWQIAQFVFCDQQQTLTSNDSAQQLEPMLVELLSYFCQHSDQIISKDQLIEQVWLGRVVSDNAVSKSITKLRKAFEDDVRQPRFIATFPKKGYKFIANPLEIQSNEASSTLPIDALSAEQAFSKKVIYSDDVQAAQIESPKNTFGGMWKNAVVLFLLVWGMYTFLNRESAVQQTPAAIYAKALTTDAGDELFPAFSPDGTRVSYMSIKADRIHLMIKNVIDESIVEISHEEGVGVGPADWSPDGKSIVYLVATPQRCQYYIRSVDGMAFGEPRLIHECPAGSYGKIAFTQDKDRLVYSESAGGNSPYSMYEISLSTGKKKRLNQPELHIGGNSQFDLHPTDNKLLISSPDKQQWEGFYSLDLDSGQLELLFEQDAYICCGIWSHQGDRVVLMGEHPAYQLLSYDLKGEDRTVIYSGSRIIRAPGRHINGTDYLFTSGEKNINFNALDLDSKQQQVIANDSVDELLATFAHHSSQIAYIGLATGNEEIWVLDSKTGQRKKLTQFDDSRHYIDLMWSPEGDYLVGLTLNEIHLVNAVTGTYEALAIPQTEIRGVSFKSNTSIAYSIREGERWRVYAYQIEDNRVVPEDPDWQFIQYHPIAGNRLWLNQSNQLFVGAEQTPVENKLIPIESLLNGRQFNLKKRGHLWLWFKWSERREIASYSQESQTVYTVIQTDVSHFDIKDNQLLFGTTQEVNSNIYQTQVLD